MQSALPLLLWTGLAAGTWSDQAFHAFTAPAGLPCRSLGAQLLRASRSHACSARASGDWHKMVKAVLQKRRALQHGEGIQWGIIEDMKNVDFACATSVDGAAHVIAESLSNHGLAVIPDLLPPQMVESLAHELKARRKQVICEGRMQARLFAPRCCCLA